MSVNHRRFAVTCKSCGRVLFTAAQIADPEIAILVEHLVQCSPRFRADAPLGTVLERLIVETATS